MVGCRERGPAHGHGVSFWAEENVLGDGCELTANALDCTLGMGEVYRTRITRSRLVVRPGPLVAVDRLVWGDWEPILTPRVLWTWAGPCTGRQPHVDPMPVRTCHHHAYKALEAGWLGHTANTQQPSQFPCCVCSEAHRAFQTAPVLAWRLSRPSLLPAPGRWHEACQGHLAAPPSCSRNLACPCLGHLDSPGLSACSQGQSTTPAVPHPGPPAAACCPGIPVSSPA